MAEVKFFAFLEYCREYTFQTMLELRSELNIMWESDDIMKQIEKVVLVASMKNKPRVLEAANTKTAKKNQNS